MGYTLQYDQTWLAGKTNLSIEVYSWENLSISRYTYIYMYIYIYVYVYVNGGFPASHV